MNNTNPLQALSALSFFFLFLIYRGVQVPLPQTRELHEHVSPGGRRYSVCGRPGHDLRPDLQQPRRPRPAGEKRSWFFRWSVEETEGLKKKKKRFHLSSETCSLLELSIPQRSSGVSTPRQSSESAFCFSSFSKGRELKKNNKAASNVCGTALMWPLCADDL